MGKVAWPNMLVVFDVMGYIGGSPAAVVLISGTLTIGSGSPIAATVDGQFLKVTVPYNQPLGPTTFSWVWNQAIDNVTSEQTTGPYAVTIVAQPVEPPVPQVPTSPTRQGRRLAEPDDTTVEQLNGCNLAVFVQMPYQILRSYVANFPSVGPDSVTINYVDGVGNQGQYVVNCTLWMSDNGYVFISADNGTQFLVASINPVFWNANAPLILARNQCAGTPTLSPCANAGRYDYPTLLPNQIAPALWIRDGVVMTTPFTPYSGPCAPCTGSSSSSSSSPSSNSSSSSRSSSVSPSSSHGPSSSSSSSSGHPSSSNSSSSAPSSNSSSGSSNSSSSSSSSPSSSSSSSSGGGVVPTSGLIVWLDSSLGVTAPGGNVTAWADQTVNGNNFTTTSGTPTVVNSVFGSLPAIQFGGAAYMQSVMNAFWTNQTATSTYAVIVWQTQGVTNGGLVGVRGDTGAGSCTWVIYTNNGPGTFIFNGSTNTNLPISATTNEQMIVSTIGDTSNFTMYKNGVSIGAEGYGMGGPAYPYCSLGISYAGNGTGSPLTAEIWTGSIGALLIYDHKLTSPNDAAVISYLKTRFGIP